MKDVFSVSITIQGPPQTYSASFQIDAKFELGWQSVLKSAYGRAEICCGCRGVGPKRLAVKYYEGTDKFSLARFALTGGQHARDCQYYSAGATSSGAGSYATGVIEDKGDGSVKIRLEIGMVQQTDAAPEAPGRDAAVRKPSVKQSSMKLLGLLHYLWEEAGLNQWKPAFHGKRKASLAYWLLHTAAEDVWAGKLKLVDQLLLPAFGAESREAQRNRNRVASSCDAKRRMIIIAPLAAYTAERMDAMGKQLKIGGFHGMPLAFMQTGLWESTQRRFRNALAGWKQGHPTIAIAQIELKQRANGVVGSVIDLGVMSVTAEFIPVESSYERVVANELVERGRGFTKPMRYDAGADQVLPDFVLTDTAVQVPLEVFGRDDPDYLKRKDEKTAYYDAQYGREGWWGWDASTTGEHATLPPFPRAG